MPSTCEEAAWMKTSSGSPSRLPNLTRPNFGLSLANRARCAGSQSRLAHSGMPRYFIGSVGCT